MSEENGKMRCKGPHIPPWFTEPDDPKTEKCGSTNWEAIWEFRVDAESRSYYLVQCQRCKRVVAVTQDQKDSDDFV